MLRETFHIAVPTAFHNDESINLESTINHIKNLFHQGVKSVLVSGTTGEQHSLSIREKLQLLDRLQMEVELMEQMEIIFGVSAVRQKEAEELARAITKTSISGVMIGYPPYIIPTQEEAIAYTKAIIELSDKPTILYNNPNRTGFDLSIESIIQLSKTKKVIGLKEAGKVEKVPILKSEIKSADFYYYAGGEVNLEQKIENGFNRLSSISGNIAPLEIKQWFNKLLHNEEITKEERDTVETIVENVFQGSFLVNLKEKISQQGIPMGICRSPIGNS